MDGKTKILDEMIEKRAVVAQEYELSKATFQAYSRDKEEELALYDVMIDAARRSYLDNHLIQLTESDDGDIETVVDEDDQSMNGNVSRVNPFHNNTAKWAVYEVMQNFVTPVHLDEVFREVSKVYPFARNTVRNALLYNPVHYRKEENGYFSFIG